MQKLLLIANPAASGFTGGAHRDAVAVLNQDYEVSTSWPESGAEATRSAAAAAAGGFDVVAAMGGDGVVHRVANGIVGTDTALAIIPSGTTDVLARILGIPRQPKKAAALLSAHQPAPAPVARYEAEGPGGPITGYALFALGIGLDAEVVERAEGTPDRKNWFGGVYYARHAASMFFRRFRSRQPNMRVSSDDRRADAVAVLTQIRWPYTYFGSIPLKLTPRAEPGLAVGIVTRVPIRRAIMLGGTALLGRGMARLEGVDVWQGVDSFEIDAEPPSKIQADGELLGDVVKLRVTLERDALRIIAPR